ncbi:type II toxin-antitoxin system RelE family toxin [Allokutzneria albata]|uniref:type II toxin-antitoxin system RelE family toxin n=1 Tax=Allokutzneria albata TaxID=211114 RepID=UPI0018D43DE7
MVQRCQEGDSKRTSRGGGRRGSRALLGPSRENPYRVGKPLREPFEGLWSARRATYRVVYRIDEEQRTIMIETIRHRGDAYR